MQKRALIRRIELAFFDLLSCDIYLDFLNRGASRDIDVTDWPGA
jgi:hypothetical protein